MCLFEAYWPPESAQSAEKKLAKEGGTFHVELHVMSQYVMLEVVYSCMIYNDSLCMLKYVEMISGAPTSQIMVEP